jgi:short-subunit dehydrogenase
VSLRLKLNCSSMVLFLHKGLLKHNATVYLAARDQIKASEAIAELKTSTGKEAHFLSLDLSDLQSIKASAKTFNEYGFIIFLTFCSLLTPASL